MTAIDPILERLDMIITLLEEQAATKEKHLPHDHEYEWANERQAIEITGLSETGLKKRQLFTKRGQANPDGIFRVQIDGRGIRYYVPDLADYVDRELAEQDKLRKK